MFNGKIIKPNEVVWLQPEQVDRIPHAFRDVIVPLDENGTETTAEEVEQKKEEQVQQNPQYSKVEDEDYPGYFHLFDHLGKLVSEWLTNDEADEIKKSLE